MESGYCKSAECDPLFGGSKHSPSLSAGGQGRLQRSGTCSLEVVIIFVMGGGVVILSQVGDNGSCSGYVFQPNNQMHLKKLLREGLRFLLLRIAHNMVCGTLGLVHFSFTHYSWVSLLEQSWKWLTALCLKWVRSWDLGLLLPRAADGQRGIQVLCPRFLRAEENRCALSNARWGWGEDLASVQEVACPGVWWLVCVWHRSWPHRHLPPECVSLVGTGEISQTLLSQNHLPNPPRFHWKPLAS